MKAIIYKGILLLLSIGLLLSCSKDEGDDNEKAYSCLAYKVHEVFDPDDSSDYIDIEGYFYFRADKSLINASVVAGDEIFEFSTVYDKDYLKELLDEGNDGYNYKYTYNYTDEKITNIKIYSNWKEVGKKSSLVRSFKTKKNAVRQSSDLYLYAEIDISYTGDEPNTITVNPNEGEEETLTLTWNQGNISEIYWDGYWGSNATLSFEYDNAANPMKGIALNPLFSIYTSETLLYFIDQLGVLSYFNENNIKKISIEGGEMINISINYNLSYDSGIITHIEGLPMEGSAEELDGYSFSCHIEYECD
ncbi:MAG: hypothetical protein ABFS12_17960 [Bacteroidota bacterium]